MANLKIQDLEKKLNHYGKLEEKATANGNMDEEYKFGIMQETYAEALRDCGYDVRFNDGLKWSVHKEDN